MYLAEELWSLCWTNVLYQHLCLRTKKTAYKMRSKEK